MIYLVCLTAFLFVLLPLNRIGKKLPFDLNKVLARILWLLSPIAAYYVLQRFFGTSTREFLQLLVSRRGMLNVFILAVLWWGFYMVTNRTKYSAVLIAFCAAERPPVRLPAATQRSQRPEVSRPSSAQS